MLFRSEAKTQALIQAAEKLMQAAQQQAQAGQAQQQQAQGSAKNNGDDVVDAEFEEVKDK